MTTALLEPKPTRRPAPADDFDDPNRTPAMPRRLAPDALRWRASNRLLSVLSKVVVGSTFINLILGSLVTGNKAALADPTWPSFVGHWYPRIWTGGLFYEDGHRVKGMILGVLALALAGSAAAFEPRPWVRRLAWGMVALVIAQGVMGGMIIKSFRNPAVSMIHASLAEFYLAVVVVLAVSLSKGWWRMDGRMAGGGEPQSHPADTPPDTPADTPAALAPVAFLAAAAAVLAYGQIVLGSGIRHADESERRFWGFLGAHVGVWMALAAAAAMLGFAVWKSDAPAARTLRTPVSWVMALVMFQGALGTYSGIANRARLKPGVPEPLDILVTSTHLATGATIFALLVAVAFISRRQAADSFNRMVSA